MGKQIGWKIGGTDGDTDMEVHANPQINAACGNMCMQSGLPLVASEEAR